MLQGGRLQFLKSVRSGGRNLEFWFQVIDGVHADELVLFGCCVAIGELLKISSTFLERWQAVVINIFLLLKALYHSNSSILLEVLF